MMHTVPLESLRCGIRWLVSIEAVKRHSNGDMNAAINRSIQRFREAASLSGEPYFLERTPVTLTVGAAAGLPYGTVDVSTLTNRCLRIFGVEIVVQGRTVVLDPVQFSARNDYHVLETYQDVPLAWTHINASTIAILPASDAAYSCRVWYLPTHTPVSNDADLVEVLSSGDEWIIRDVAIQMLERDAKPELIGVMMQERDAVLSQIVTSMSSAHNAGATARRDTRTAREYSRWVARSRQ